MPTYRAAQIPQAGGAFELVDREACGVCRSDMSGDARFRVVLTTGS